jgi:hypothetical protein
MAPEESGSKQCPTCGSWDVRWAMIEDGGLGDWCDNCKKSLKAMGKQMDDGYQYGFFFCIWLFVAVVAGLTGYIVGAGFEGHWHGIQITHIIFFLFVIYPAGKCIQILILEKEEKGILYYLHCLIKEGRYDKAKVFLKWNQNRISDEDLVSELEERLDVLSPQIPLQKAVAKALQGIVVTVLKVLAYIWFGFFGIVLIVNLIRFSWRGFTILGLISLPLLFFPGIAALLLTKWLEKRKKSTLQFPQIGEEILTELTEWGED